MKKPVSKRTNEDWLRALRGEIPGDAAIEELRDYLAGYLSRLSSGRGSLHDNDDIVQESLTRIVKSLDSFRGDSAFTTWAAAVATRTAFTEMRRRRVREERQESFESLVEGTRSPATTTESPDIELTKSDMLGALHRAIDSELTARQRIAILAEHRGLPTIEIAEKLETNQNALYKLVHDARKKLRKALLDMGFDAESLHEQATETPS